jgi:hypothetical protein
VPASWPEFSTFYSQLSPEQLKTLSESVRDPAFSRLTAVKQDARESPNDAWMESVWVTALAVSIHLLHAYHDWLKSELTTPSSRSHHSS